MTLAPYEPVRDKKAKEDYAALEEARAEVESRISALEEDKATLVADLEATKEKHQADLSEKDTGANALQARLLLKPIE